MNKSSKSCYTEITHALTASRAGHNSSWKNMLISTGKNMEIKLMHNLHLCSYLPNGHLDIEKDDLL